MDKSPLYLSFARGEVCCTTYFYHLMCRLHLLTLSLFTFTWVGGVGIKRY